MADLTIKYFPNNMDPSGRHTIVAQYSDALIHTVEVAVLERAVSEIAAKFVDQHYAEIEKMIDVKVVAALVSHQAGAEVEKKMEQEISRINSVANEAKSLAKRRY
jgi:hypothetical protein